MTNADNSENSLDPDRNSGDLENMNNVDLPKMEALKRQVLEELFHLLTQNIEPKRHYGYLRSKSILIEEDCEVIEHCVTRREKAEKFLDMLVKRGPSAFDHFCDSLVNERTQLFLLEKINIALEEKISGLQLESGETAAWGDEPLDSLMTENEMESLPPPPVSNSLPSPDSTS